MLIVLIFFSLWRGQTTRCTNQIEEVCKDIEKTINQTIQNTLNALEKDCERISQLVDKTIDDDNRDRAYNLRASGKGDLKGTRKRNLMAQEGLEEDTNRS